MLSREIPLSDLSLSGSPILKTLPGSGLSKGSKLWPQRSSVFQCRADDGSLTPIKILKIWIHLKCQLTQFSPFSNQISNMFFSSFIKMLGYQMILLC